MINVCRRNSPLNFQSRTNEKRPNDSIRPWWYVVCFRLNPITVHGYIWYDNVTDLKWDSMHCVYCLPLHMLAYHYKTVILRYTCIYVYWNYNKLSMEVHTHCEAMVRELSVYRLQFVRYTQHMYTFDMRRNKHNIHTYYRIRLFWLKNDNDKENK